MSRKANVQPSSTALARWARSWLSDRPAKAPRIRSFQRGAVAPHSVGKKSTPSEPAGTLAASSNSSACEVPSTVQESHKVLPPETKPGFSIR